MHKQGDHPDHRYREPSIWTTESSAYSVAKVAGHARSVARDQNLMAQIEWGSYRLRPGMIFIWAMPELVLCMSANAFGSDSAQLEAATFRFRDPLYKEGRTIAHSHIVTPDTTADRPNKKTHQYDRLGIRAPSKRSPEDGMSLNQPDSFSGSRSLPQQPPKIGVAATSEIVDQGLSFRPWCPTRLHRLPQNRFRRVKPTMNSPALPIAADHRVQNPN